MDAKPVIRITVDGEPAQTIDLAAEAHGLGHHAMRHALDRAGAQPIEGTTIGRQPLYAQAVVNQVMANRKGRGAPGVPRPHVPPAERAAMAGRLRAKAQGKT